MPGVGAIGLTDLTALLWRERLTVLVVGAIVAVLGLVTVMQLPTWYQSAARVLVLYDDAYLHNPLLGDAAPRTLLSPEQIIRAETDFLETDELKRRAIERVGLDVIFPELARAAENGPEARRDRALGDAVRALSEQYSVSVTPNSPTIAMSVRHNDPAVASQVANAMLDEYFNYRREVLVGSPPEGLEQERLNTEQRLDALNADMETFLRDNGLGDFEGERDAARVRAASMSEELYSTRARHREVDGRLSVLREALDAIPAQVDIYVEDAAAQRMQALAVEREELLAGFEFDSEPVSEIDARIGRLEAAIVAGLLPRGLTRTGPNPVHQTLVTEKIQLEAESISLTQREEALEAQLAETRARQLRLQQLAPEFNHMARETVALSNTVRRFIEREEQGRATRALAEQSIETVRTVERAVAPTKGSSLRRPAGVGVLALAGLAALIAGLARAASRGAFGFQMAPAAYERAPHRGGFAYDRPPARPWAPRPRPRVNGNGSGRANGNGHANGNGVESDDGGDHGVPPDTSAPPPPH